MYEASFTLPPKWQAEIIDVHNKDVTRKDDDNIVTFKSNKHFAVRVFAPGKRKDHLLVFGIWNK